MDIRAMLEQVQAGEMPIAQAEQMLKDLPYEDLGFAKLDHHRKLRSGFGEVVFCAGKPDEYLVKIFQKFYEEDAEVMGTRASREQYELVKALVPEIVYDPISRIMKAEKPDKAHVGNIAVCTGGTADIPVAEEAAQTAEFFGCHVERIYDVGQLRGGSGRHGGRSGNGDRGAGGASGHRSAHLGGIWRQFSRAVGAADDDQLLCQWHFGGKY